MVIFEKSSTSVCQIESNLSWKVKDVHVQQHLIVIGLEKNQANLEPDREILVNNVN